MVAIGARAGSEVGVFVGLASFFSTLRGRGGVAGEGGGDGRARRLCRRARRCDIAQRLSTLSCSRLFAPWSRAGAWRSRLSANRRDQRRCGRLLLLASRGKLRRRWARSDRAGWWIRLSNRSRNRSRRTCPTAILRSERKAIQRPSGDHLGSESWPDCVSWIRSRPCRRRDRARGRCGRFAGPSRRARRR